MLAEIAILSLCLALMLQIIAGAALLPNKLGELCAEFVDISAFLNAALVFLAFVILIILRIDSDFTVANVADHSSRALPLLYKITGSWGNHEGSMLLFACIISGYGAFLACGKNGRKFEQLNSTHKEHKERRAAISIQSLLAAGIVLFILLASNPFLRIFPPPADGRMLNPLLQDVALALHPPLLYLGYVGFSAVFSLALAGMIYGKIDRNWANSAHSWIMFAWSTLTIGIALGSWWAYRELGWGGFWFWDPVENAALLPWLAATALLHSNIALAKRGIFAAWVALLAIGSFALSLIGTFLVRSGALTSVHSFASDPERGIYILAYLVISIGTGLWFYARAGNSFAIAAPLRPNSREGAIAINNLFLITACATLLLGTLYPLLVDALGGRAITIGAPYYNRTILPLLAIPLLLSGIAAFIPWKKARIFVVLRRGWLAFLLMMIAFVLVIIVIDKKAIIVASGFALSAWIIGGSAGWLADNRWKRLGSWPVFLSHFGMAILIIGITGSGLLSRQLELQVKSGDNFSFAGYQINFSALENIATPSYIADRAVLLIKRDPEKNEPDNTEKEIKSYHSAINQMNLIDFVSLAMPRKITALGSDFDTISRYIDREMVLFPEYRSYAVGGNLNFTSEAAIYSNIAYDFYAVIGETDSDGKTALRLYYKPSVSFIWLGACFIASGGLLAAFAAILRRRNYFKEM